MNYEETLCSDWDSDPGQAAEVHILHTKQTWPPGSSRILQSLPVTGHSWHTGLSTLNFLASPPQETLPYTVQTFLISSISHTTFSLSLPVHTLNTVQYVVVTPTINLLSLLHNCDFTMGMNPKFFGERSLPKGSPRLTD